MAASDLRDLKGALVRPVVPPAGRDRLSGAYGRARRPHCRAAPGPDCAAKSRTSRQLRHRARHDLEVWVREETGCAPEYPLADASDCAHGCSGYPSCTGSRCTFVCHPVSDTGSQTSAEPDRVDGPPA